MTGDLYPDDRYLTAVAARNIAWARYATAHAAWLAAGSPVGPLLRAVNETQHDYEWSERDLVRARVEWRGERAA